MPFPIEKKFVIAVSSSALFDMVDCNKIFEEQGLDAYNKFQMENIDNPLPQGVAFPFIRRFLTLNDSFPTEQPVEVVLLSKNSPECGLRAMRSIKHYGLNITRAHFSSGMNNYHYLPAFNATLFLSANPKDTREAIRAGYAAGTVLNQHIIDNPDDKELRLAFDFDGVIADDSAETVYQEEGIDNYMAHEQEMKDVPLNSGPIGELLKKISGFQKLEAYKQKKEPTYRPMLNTAIITARNAPAHERVVTTLKDMDINVNQVFFLGGIDKSRILTILKPHIFFDDQMTHLKNLVDVPAVHIPFGVTNEYKKESLTTEVSQGEGD